MQLNGGVGPAGPQSTVVLVNHSLEVSVQVSWRTSQKEGKQQWIYDKNKCMYLCSTPRNRWIVAEQQGCRSHLLVKNVQNWFKPFKVQKGTKIQAQT